METSKGLTKYWRGEKTNKEKEGAMARKWKNASNWG